MSEQPLALLLADELFASYGHTDLDLNDCVTAELRRQHSEIEQLKAERDALLAQRQPKSEPQPEPVPAMGKRLIMVDETFDALMYWLERCEDKGHLENCADLIEPWNNFQYTESPQRQPLSDEEIKEIANTPAAMPGSYVHAFARALEKTHGIGGDK